MSRHVPVTVPPAMAPLVPVAMRAAGRADIHVLLRWRNDPLTCANFHARAPVTAAIMSRWLCQALDDPRVTLQIAVRAGLDLGVLRVDPDGAVLIIVAPEARGQVLAGAMLRHLPGTRLFAEIRPTNIASRRAFERAGFTREGTRYGMLLYTREPPAAGSVTTSADRRDACAEAAHGSREARPDTVRDPGSPSFLARLGAVVRRPKGIGAPRMRHGANAEPGGVGRAARDPGE